ncbi:branched-chain amino acid ABC transporter permease [Solibacillus sp. FSL W7-1464]|uniref:branched-chain amino acid ABC transporter permease n=1 Tax=Solibacillus sp. FSL W7-1464 TaxID=2921706 RepID=UPI0030F96ABC
MNAELLFQSLIDGILMGGIYGLVAIGLTLIFGVMKIINFAQGALLMLGMYVSYWCFALFGLSPYLSLPLSALVLFFIGAGMQRGILQRMAGAPDHNQLLVTLGITLFIENLALVVFKPDFRSVTVDGIPNSISFLNLNIHTTKLIAFGFTIVLAIGLFFFLRKTYIGKSIRATSMNSGGAALVGVNIKKINYIAFGIGAALAGIAGALITPFFYTSPSVGSSFILIAFVVVVLGGLGNFLGALVGGVLIGVTEALGGAILPGSLKELVPYVIFILVLLLKPNGLFGGKAR